MASTLQPSPYTPQQIQLWLRGLLTVAWADGHFEDSEKDLIHTIVESELAPEIAFADLSPLEPTDLAAANLSEADAHNFLRMAVLVALADGIYSDSENEKIMAFAQALALNDKALASLQETLEQIKTLDQLAPDTREEDRLSASSASSQPEIASAASPLQPPKLKKASLDPLKPTRQWLDQLKVDDPRFARFICKLVPSQCPFERDVKLFGHKVVHIPPMCKLNPLYEQLVGLRFRALSYLADDCGEDVSAYL